MEELVAHVVAKTGVNPAVARKAVAIIFSFLMREGKSDKIGALVDALPGAREAAAASTGTGSGVMGVFGDLTAAGLGMMQVQSVAKAFIGFARDKAGKATVDEVVASIPGLAQFV